MDKDRVERGRRAAARTSRPARAALLLIVIILSRPESGLSLGVAAVVRREGYLLLVTGQLSTKQGKNFRHFIALF